MHLNKEQLHALVDWECDPHVLTESGAKKVAAARELFKDVKHQSIDLSPECPELQEVLDHLSAALFWLNAGIARNETQEPHPISQDEVKPPYQPGLTMLCADSSGEEKITVTFPADNQSGRVQVIRSPPLTDVEREAKIEAWREKQKTEPRYPDVTDFVHLLNQLSGSKVKNGPFAKRFAGLNVEEKNKEIVKIIDNFAQGYRYDGLDRAMEKLKKEYLILSIDKLPINILDQKKPTGTVDDLVD